MKMEKNEKKSNQTIKNESKVVIVKATDIRLEKMQFLWPNRIPLGYITTYYGMPQQGKSTQALDVAARISVGKEWPDSTVKSPKGSILLISPENVVREEKLWRYDALGGERSKLYVLNVPIATNQNCINWFDITKDLPSVENKIKEINDLKLIIIDPISAYFGNIGTYRNSKVWRMSKSLNILAQTYKIAILLIHHVNKNTQHGSTVFDEFTWQDWLFGPAKETKTQKVMLSAKKSYGPPATGLTFSVKQTDPANINNIELIYEKEPVKESTQEYFNKQKEQEQILNDFNALQVMVDKCCKIYTEPSERIKHRTPRDWVFDLHKAWYEENNLKSLGKASFGMKFHHLGLQNVVKKQIMQQGERIMIYEGLEILPEVHEKYLANSN